MIDHSNNHQSNHAVETQRVHIFVEGRVQGVGFRYFTLEIANRFEITGWVRNTHNQEVEITAEGSREKLDQFINIIRRGPNAGFVKHLRIQWQSTTGEFKRFSVISSF
jgi:acylphosphatase